MTETFDQWKARKFVENQRANLLEKIRLASKLGFASDVQHWKSKLKELDVITEEGK